MVTNMVDSRIFSMRFTLRQARNRERRPPAIPIKGVSPILKIPGTISAPSAARGMALRNLDRKPF